MNVAAVLARPSPSRSAKATRGAGSPGPLLQRKCQCGATAQALGAAACPQCEDKKKLQKKLTIGSSNDPLEREADRVADQVLAAPARFATSAATPSIHRLAWPSAGGFDGVPASVERVLASSGRPLENALALDLGHRFGHDFAQVRIHADAPAAEATRAVGARAFTVGRHIAFGDGELSRGGLHLLAHELTHTIQQGSAREVGEPAGRRSAATQDLHAGVLQRQAAPPTEAKTDAAIVLAADSISWAEGGALAPRVVRVESMAELCAKVDGIGQPIGTLFVISHADSSGVLRITGPSGIQIDLTMNDLAAALKKCKRIPQVVDFRGCTVGAAGAEVDKFLDASGVAKAVSTDCAKRSARSTPITVAGIEAEAPSQGPTTTQGKADFDNALLQRVKDLVADNGKRVSHCLIGFPSRMPTRNDLPALRKLYWANKGRLVASWASPVNNGDWQEGSRCMKDLTATTSPCARIEKAAPKAAPSKQPAKPKGAMLGSEVMPRLVLDPHTDPESLA